MSRYLSPLTVEGEVALEGLSTVAQAATTVFTTPNKDDYNGALYAADVFVRINTADAGAAAAIGISLVYTEGASARTKIVPLTVEAGTVGTTMLTAAANSANGSIVFRADKNTAVQYTRVAAGAPNNNGDFDVFVTIRRIR